MMTATTQPTTEKKNRTHSFTTLERVLAVGMLLLSWGLFHILPVWEKPYHGLAFLLFLFALTLVTLYKTHRPLRGMALAVCLSALPISLSLLVPADPMIHTFAFLYAMVAYAYTVYAACGNTLETGLSELLPLDVLKAVFFLPFSAIGALFSALSFGEHAVKKSGRFLGRVLAGFALALLPTMVVFALLAYDDRFLAQIGDVLHSLLQLDTLFTCLWELVQGLLLTLYLFGLYTAATEKRLPDCITAESCHKTAEALHLFSPVTTVSATAPVLCLYGIFFFTQWEDYISAFRGALPEDMIYSAYAREGFFELCWVSAINLVLLICTGMSTNQVSASGTNQVSASGTYLEKADKPHPALRVLHVVLSVCTLCLIATAMAKLGLYMQAYGLTEKRVYAAWFLVVLTGIFVLVIVKQIRPKMKVVVWSATVCVAMFALLALSNVPGIVEWYNGR